MERVESHYELDMGDENVDPQQKIAKLFATILERRPDAVVIYASVGGAEGIVVAVAGPLMKIAWLEQETEGSVRRVLDELARNEREELNG